MELNATVMGPQEAKRVMGNMVQQAACVPQVKTANQHELIGEQADALVDIWYYSLNAAAKKGVNLSSVFDLVHSANMAKVNPTTGKCMKRPDGKIIKPPGWTAPNVTAEMERQGA